jgi:hypothetical protein
MSHYAVIVGEPRNRLLGPFQTQEERERSIGFNIFDYPVATVVRLDLCAGNLTLKELGSSPRVTRQLTLFNPEP